MSPSVQRRLLMIHAAVSMIGVGLLLALVGLIESHAIADPGIVVAETGLALVAYVGAGMVVIYVSRLRRSWTFLRTVPVRRRRSVAASLRRRAEVQPRDLPTARAVAESTRGMRWLRPLYLLFTANMAVQATLAPIGFRIIDVALVAVLIGLLVIEMGRTRRLLSGFDALVGVTGTAR